MLMTPKNNILNRSSFRKILLMKSYFLQITAMGLFLLAGLTCHGAERTTKPNILFLFTDDQRADTIAALGNRHIITPNIDKLVEQGMSFSNAYCMGGTSPAVCLPSRAMVLSGQSLYHLPPPREIRSKKFKTNLARSFNDAGYVTYHHGKSGNTPHGIHAQFDHSRYVSNDQKERMSGRPGKEIADAAVEFLDAHQTDKPLLMYLAFGNPHDPRVVIDEVRNRYDEQQMPLPKNYMPLHPFDNGEMIIRDETLAPWPRTKAEMRRQLTDYYGVMTYLDEQIGRVINKLKEIGVYENTIIVYSSDHGLAMGSHGLMGKQNLYDHSMKSPLVFSGPGIPQGQSDTFVYLYDLFPTFCELAGVTLPENIDGQSFAPVLAGEKFQGRDKLFLGYMNVQRALRDGHWKLIQYPQVNQTQLFNLAEDPDELNNLADDAKYQEIRERLLKQLAEVQAESGDHLPLTSNQPKPAKVTAEEITRRSAAALKAREKARRKK